jgi:hypothetical protein
MQGDAMLKRLVVLFTVFALVFGAVAFVGQPASVDAHEGHGTGVVQSEVQTKALNAVANARLFQYTHVYYETHKYWGCSWNGSFYQWTWVQHRHTFVYSNNQTTETTGWGYMYYNGQPLTCYP